MICPNMCSPGPVKSIGDQSYVLEKMVDRGLAQLPIAKLILENARHKLLDARSRGWPGNADLLYL
jgi:hypothetical protein